MPVLDFVKLPARLFRESWPFCHCWELPSLLLVPWAQNFSAGLPEPLGFYGCPETYSGLWMVGRNSNFTLAYLGPEAVLLVPKVLHIFQELWVSGPSPSSLFPNWNKQEIYLISKCQFPRKDWDHMFLPLAPPPLHALQNNQTNHFPFLPNTYLGRGVLPTHTWYMFMMLSSSSDRIPYHSAKLLCESKDVYLWASVCHSFSMWSPVPALHIVEAQWRLTF